jgi:hypothetical protein
MMSDKHIDEIITNTPKGKSPIFYGSIGYSLLVRNKLVAYAPADKVVFKGSRFEILKSALVKRSVLMRHFLDASEAKKKANEFDLSKIKLNRIIVEKFISYGVKQD